MHKYAELKEALDKRLVHEVHLETVRELIDDYEYQRGRAEHFAALNQTYLARLARIQSVLKEDFLAFVQGKGRSDG